MTDAVPGVRANASRTVPPLGEWRTALPMRLTRIWITARSWPLAGSVPTVSGSIAISRSSAVDSSITTASAASAARSIGALAVRRVLAHRAHDREQVARRCGDVVAIACIIAAQRPVGALDDPLGAFDDAVERRAQHFVQGMVERGDARRLSRRRRCAFELRGAAEAGEAPVGGGDDFAVQHQHPAVVRAAARALAGESRGAQRAR